MRRSGSWRHAIFKKVVSPQTTTSMSERILPGRGGYSTTTPNSSKCLFRPKRTREEIRQLWKTAINQQIILIRMEKQNLRLKG
jgi:TBC1 domain-containing protein 4